MAVIDGEEQISVLKDGDGDACPGTFTEISSLPRIIPDVITGVTPELPTPALTPAIAADGVLQLQADNDAERPVTLNSPMRSIVALSSELILGEVLLVIGDDLVAGSGTRCPALSGLWRYLRRYGLRGNRDGAITGNLAEMTFLRLPAPR